jgi:hypothetical protein
LPAEAHEITLPSGSVIEMIVLLKVDRIWATPWTMFFFSLRRVFLALRGPAKLRFLPSRLSSVLLLGLLLAGDCLAGSLACAGVSVSSLPVHGQAPPVPQTLVATDVDLSLDILVYLSAKITFDPVVVADEIAQTHDFFVGEVANSRSGVDARAGASLLGASRAYAEDIGERDIKTFVARQVNSGDSSH